MEIKFVRQVALKYSKWPKHLPTLSIPKPQNWDFCYANMPTLLFKTTLQNN
jgi:hypothetical protein